MRLVIGKQKSWCVPPDGKHSPGAEVSKWPKWKIAHFSTNFVWPSEVGILIKRFWIYTKFGAIHADFYYKSSKWDWWVEKNSIGDKQ